MTTYATLLVSVALTIGIGAAAVGISIGIDAWRRWMFRRRVHPCVGCGLWPANNCISRRGACRLVCWRCGISGPFGESERLAEIAWNASMEVGVQTSADIKTRLLRRGRQ